MITWNPIEAALSYADQYTSSDIFVGETKRLVKEAMLAAYVKALADRRLAVTGSSEMPNNSNRELQEIREILMKKTDSLQAEIESLTNFINIGALNNPYIYTSEDGFEVIKEEMQKRVELDRQLDSIIRFVQVHFPRNSPEITILSKSKFPRPITNQPTSFIRETPNP